MAPPAGILEERTFEQVSLGSASLWREKSQRMTVVLRNYQGPGDLSLQHTFWLQATHDLPWCWKPTVSPELYSVSPQFNPRSRCFAFDDDLLVGYMSFTGQGGFVSLGYPWVLPGYEGELQESLYDEVHGFAASSEYGGKIFAQRFRRQWTTQISFFTRHGFTEHRSEPIYALDLRSGWKPHVPTRFRIELLQVFKWEEFSELAEIRCPVGQLRMSEIYFRSVNFDFAVKATQQGRPTAYLGFTIRSDTGFAELIAVAVDEEAVSVLDPCLAAAVEELRFRSAFFLGTKTLPMSKASQNMMRMGFMKVSDELMFSKSI